MSTMPPTGRRGARRFVEWMFVGCPPSEAPGRFRLVLVLLSFVAWCFSAAFTWGALPPPLTLSFFGLWLSVILGTLGNLAHFRRWGGARVGELLRLGSSLFVAGFVALLFAHFFLTEQWGWFWWTAFVLTVATAVVVAKWFYGPDDGPQAGPGPSN